MLTYPNAFALNSQIEGTLGWFFVQERLLHRKFPAGLWNPLDRELQWALNFQGSSPR